MMKQMIWSLSIFAAVIFIAMKMAWERWNPPQTPTSLKQYTQEGVYVCIAVFIAYYSQETFFSVAGSKLGNSIPVLIDAPEF